MAFQKKGKQEGESMGTVPTPAQPEEPKSKETKTK